MSLQRSLKALMTLVPKNDIRYYLNGVNVEYLPDLKIWHLEATDGHRAARIVLPASVEYLKPVESGEPCQLIIPKSIVDDVLRGTNDKSRISITFETPNRGFLNKDNMRMSFEPIDGRYPDLNRVIPKNNRTVNLNDGYCVRGSYLGDIGKFVNALKSSSYGEVLLQFGETLDLCKMHVNFGAKTDYLEVIYILMPVNIKKNAGMFVRTSEPKQEAA